MSAGTASLRSSTKPGAAARAARSPPHPGRACARPGAGSCGEGLGAGVERFGDDASTCDPPPQPSPTRGEGEGEVVLRSLVILFSPTTSILKTAWRRSVFG